MPQERQLQRHAARINAWNPLAKSNGIPRRQRREIAFEKTYRDDPRQHQLLAAQRARHKPDTHINQLPRWAGKRRPYLRFFGHGRNGGKRYAVLFKNLTGLPS